MTGRPSLVGAEGLHSASNIRLPGDGRRLLGCRGTMLFSSNIKNAGRAAWFRPIVVALSLALSFTSAGIAHAAEAGEGGPYQPITTSAGRRGRPARRCAVPLAVRKLEEAGHAAGDGDCRSLAPAGREHRLVEQLRRPLRSVSRHRRDACRGRHSRPAWHPRLRHRRWCRRSRRARRRLRQPCRARARQRHTDPLWPPFPSCWSSRTPR